MVDFAGVATTLSSSLTMFGNAVDKLATAIDRMPTNVEHSGQFNVVVTHNGAEAFANMNDKIREMVDKQIANAISSEFSRRLPDAPGGSVADNQRF